MKTLLRILGLGVSIFLLFAGTVTAQNSQKIRVKLSENAAARLEQKSMRKDSRGYVVTDLAALDAVNGRSGARDMRRVFPFAGKFEERHRTHGLHLWYEIAFDSNVGMAVSSLVKDYQQLAEVQIAEQLHEKKLIDAIANRSAVSSANDPQLGSQWHYDNSGQSGGTSGADISLFDAWNVEAGDDNVIVAIIDGGVDPTHSDLHDNMWVNDTENDGVPGIDDDGNGYVDDINGYNFAYGTGEIEPHYHGVHVAGTVAATNNNGIGVSGVAGGSGNGDGVRLMTCQVFAEGNSDGFDVSFVYAADNGAVISQNSWGYTMSGYYEQSVLDAIDYFIENAGYDINGNPVGPMQGGIVIFAAGNSSSSADHYPAFYDKVLAVAATDHNDQIAYFSNFGDWVDIAAPGDYVLSTYPGNSYEYLSGTSMACPHVSGAAALIVSHFPGISPEGVRQRLTSFADNIDAQNPSYVGLMGAGRLNAFNALYEDDSIPPAGINDLSFSDVSFDKAALAWTATGSSDYEGAASGYLIKYSDAPIDGSNFDLANTYSHSLSPQISGDEETLVVSGLAPSTTYYFAIKAFDYSNNYSAISNVVSFTTTAPPIISASPDSIVHHMYSGQQDTLFLSVTNVGEGVLEFNATLGAVATATTSVTASATDKAYWRYTDPDSKETKEIVIKPFSYSGQPLNNVRIGISAGSYSNYQPFADELQLRGAEIVQISTMDSSELENVDILFLDDENLALSDYGISVIRNYVDAGHAVFLQGDDYYSAAAINDILAGTGLYGTSISYTDGLLSGIFPHPITTNVSGIYSASYGMFYTMSGGSATVLINDDFANAHAAAVHFGSGRIVAIGNEIAFDPFSADNNLFLHQAIDWLAGNTNWASIAEDNFVVPSGATVQVPVFINSDKLSTGEYLADIQLQSNDPSQSLVNIPLILSVTGSASIAIEADSIDFGEVFIASSASKGLTVRNDGTDTLRLVVGVGTDSIFTVSSDGLVVAPNEEGLIEFTFNPENDLVYDRIATIASNDPQDSVIHFAISGRGVYPPIISWSPDSLSNTLPTGNIDTVFVEITNTGDSDLNASITVTADNFAASSVENVVEQINGDVRPMEGKGPSQLSSILKRTSDARYNVSGTLGISSASGLNVAVLAAEDPYYTQDVVDKLYGTGNFSSVSYIDVRSYTPTLAQIEVFDAVLVFSDYDYADGETLGNVLADYFDNGGGVVSALFEVSNWGGYYLYGRWATDQYYLIERGSITAGSRQYLEAHQSSTILDGVDSFDGGDYSYRPLNAAITDGSELIASWTDGAPLVVTKTINGKRRVDLGMFPVSSDYFWGMWNSATDGAELMANALLYTIGANNDWLAVGSTNLTVPANTSVNVPVIFNSKRKPAGTYTGSIVVSSNDPVNEIVSIPATLTVTASPVIQVPDTVIIFDTIFTGDQSYREVLIKNEGSDTLMLSVDLSDTVNFHTNALSLELEPFSQSVLPVMFTPVDEGTFDGMVTLTTNDPNRNQVIMSMQGIAVHPPAMTINPDTLQITIDAGTELTHEIEIGNIAGMSNLHWQAYTTYNDFEPSVKLQNQGVFKNKKALEALRNHIKSQGTPEKPQADTVASSNWVYLQHYEGSVTPGASNLLTGYFSAYYLLEGVYRANIHFDGNDPINTHETIPVWLNVIGKSEIYLYHSELTFDPLYVGMASTAYTYIYNGGTKPLELGTTTTPADYSTWLSDSIVYPGNYAVLEVTFIPSRAGDIQGEIVINSNDESDPEVTLQLFGTGIASPVAVITPEELFIATLKDSTQTAQFTIANDGDGDLEITIPDFIQTSSHAPMGSGYDGETDGYKWIDNLEPNGPVFEWIDITTIGSDLSLSDDSYGVANLPFEFPYYGTDQSTAYISSNGYLSFNESGAYNTSPDLIDGWSPSNVISALGKDLYPYGGRIIYHGNAERFVVTYLDIANYSSDGFHTFQMVLFPSGKIKFQYLETSGNTYGEIGIDDSNGWRGLIVPNNGTYVTNNLAIEISPNKGFVTNVSPSMATILPGATQTFYVDTDAIDLDSGRYNQVVNILTNDPQREIIPYSITLDVASQPLFTATLPDTVWIEEGGHLQFQFEATNPRASELMFGFEEPMTNATITETGFFEFNPQYDQSGIHELVVTIDDGLLNNSHRFWLNVSNVNRAPFVANPISAIETAINDIVRIDGNSLFNDLDDEWLNFEVTSEDTTIATVQLTENGEAEITPIALGLVPITISATDPYGASASEIIVLVVSENGSASLILPFEDAIISLGGPVMAYDLASHFSNGDELNYAVTISDLDIAQANVIADSLHLQALTEGETTVNIVATDPSGKSVSASFTVKVVLKITDIENGTSDDAMIIYPNPAKDKLMIQYHVRAKSTHMIQLLDATGKVVDLIYSGEQAPGEYQMLFTPDHKIHGFYLIRHIWSLGTETRKITFE